MGAWRIWLVATVACASGCDGTIGEKDLGGNLRAVDPGGPTLGDPDGGIVPPSTGGIGGEGGVLGMGGMAGHAGGGDAGAGGSGSGGAPVGGSCDDGPLAAPIPGCQPTPVPHTGDPHADCVARINQLRWECQCLPALERWVDGEACADGNAAYDSVNGFHASFSDQPCGSGARGQNECPAWSSNEQVIAGCLLDMWDEGPEDGDPGTVNGHYENMVSGSFSRVACGFYTTPGGDVWGVQNFD